MQVRLFRMTNTRSNFQHRPFLHIHYYLPTSNSHSSLCCSSWKSKTWTLILLMYILPNDPKWNSHEWNTVQCSKSEFLHNCSSLVVSLCSLRMVLLRHLEHRNVQSKHLKLRHGTSLVLDWRMGNMGLRHKDDDFS